MKNKLNTCLILILSLGMLSNLSLAQIDVDPQYGEELENQNPNQANQGNGNSGFFRSFRSLQKGEIDEKIAVNVRQDRNFWGYTYRVSRQGTRKKERKAYAFTDGSYLYLNARNYRGGGNYYVRLENVGRYAYFQDVGRQSGLGGGIGIGPVVVGTGGPRVQAMVLDLVNGEVLILKPKVMRKLLISQSDLLQRYEGAKRRGSIEVMRQYIMELNARLGN